MLALYGEDNDNRSVLMPGEVRDNYSNQSFGNQFNQRVRDSVGMPGEYFMPGQKNMYTENDHGYDLKNLNPPLKNQYDFNNNGIIDDNDSLMLKYMVEMYRTLTGEKIDLYHFKSTLDALEALKKAGEHEFLRTLLRPELYRSAKIPSWMPFPSASFQLRTSFYVTTNALGNAAIVINPFYLTTSALSTVFINNNVGLTGLASSNFFTAAYGGQTLPNNIYNQYRLVSGAVICKYVGRIDILQGVIGGAIAYDKGIVPTAQASVLASLARYGDFNLARDAMFRQEHYALSGLRELYFPLDNSFEEYQGINTAKEGFMFLVYIQNAPPSTQSFKIDLFFNFECLPDVEFMNYIPTETCKAPPSCKEEAYRIVKERPVVKESDVEVMPAPKPSSLDSFISKVGGVINKMSDWAPTLIAGGKGLVNLIRTVGK